MTIGCLVNQYLTLTNTYIAKLHEHPNSAPSLHHPTYVQHFNTHQDAALHMQQCSTPAPSMQHLST